MFLVELGDGPKHALPGSGPELCIRHGLLCHTNDLGIFPDVGNERVLEIKKFLILFVLHVPWVFYLALKFKFSKNATKI